MHVSSVHRVVDKVVGQKSFIDDSGEYVASIGMARSGMASNLTD